MASVGTRAGTESAFPATVARTVAERSRISGERDDTVDDGKLPDGSAGSRRNRVHEDYPRRPVGAAIGGAPGDIPTAAMADEHDGTCEPVNDLDHGIHPVRDADLTRYLGGFTHAGERHGMRLVAGCAEGGGHVVPRGGVKPQTGDQNDVHSHTLDPAADA